MRIVEVRTATRKNLGDLCESVNMGQHDISIMRRWYYNSNEVWAGFCRGQLVCMYGAWAASLLSNEAYLWLLTNELVREHPFLFVRHSQLIVEKLLESYAVLHGHVHARHPNSIQWLEWLGVDLKRHEVVNDLIPFDLKRRANG